MMNHVVSTSTAADFAPRPEREDAALYAAVQARFLANLVRGNHQLFRTDARDLFPLYLDNLPAEHRQYHTCNACRSFFEDYGGLAVVDGDGRLVPAVWDPEDAPPYHRPAIEAVANAVDRAAITGVFLSRDPVWGRPRTGEWTHYSLTPPTAAWPHPFKTPGQVAAEKLEEYRMLNRALEENPRGLVEKALAVVEADALYRGEKVAGVLRWLAGLHARLGGTSRSRRANVTWLVVASAPPGFCHVRGGVAGSLLQGMAAGLRHEEVAARFAAKMHPLRYQRPQAAPAAGNIAQAERVVESMGIRASLRRRFARLDEVRALWRPKPADPPRPGVFGHLTPKGTVEEAPTTLSTVTMTWDKFRRSVLPTADRIEYWADDRPGPYAGLLTAADPDAPPILQWDRPDRRNPVSWYLWHGGSLPIQWGLVPGRWHDVEAVALKPSLWDDESDRRHGDGVLFLLRGAADSRRSGLALFPETLRSDLHGIRATIEAFSRSGAIEDGAGPPACGVLLATAGTAGFPPGREFRVTSGPVKRVYILDRWD